MTKKTFSVQGMHCTSCALMIESELEDAGIPATVNYATQKLTVEFDEKIHSEKQIQTIVAKAGYRID